MNWAYHVKMVRIQGVALLAISAGGLWYVMTHEDVHYRGGWFGYVLAGASILCGFVMVVTGENPLRRNS